MIDGATPEPILLILHCELFCLFQVYENCLELYPLTTVHTTSPCKHIVVYLLFHNCLLVEGSHSIYIISLAVWFVFHFLGCFWLKICLKVKQKWRSIKLNTVCQYLLNPDMGITNTQGIIMFSIMLWDIVLFFGANLCNWILHWFIILCVFVSMCVCVCVTSVLSTLILFHNIPVVNYLHLINPFSITAIRWLQWTHCYTPITVHYHVQILDLVLSCNTRVFPRGLTPPRRKQCHHHPIRQLRLVPDARPFIPRAAGDQAVRPHHC